MLYEDDNESFATLGDDNRMKLGGRVKTDDDAEQDSFFSHLWDSAESETSCSGK